MGLGSPSGKPGRSGVTLPAARTDRVVVGRCVSSGRQVRHRTATARQPPRIKITRIETFQVPPRWLFLRIETDSGLIGWGEPIVEGKAATVAACVADVADYLMGKDPRPIERHWQVLAKGNFYRGGPVLSSVLAGIDQALWDIKGKALGVPVHELLGGPVRDSVRVYGWVGGDDPSGVAGAIAAQVEGG